MRARWGEARRYFDEHVDDDTDECILWPFATTRGYGHAWGGWVHARACEHAHGPAPPGTEACHACGNRACFNPRHLRWGTRQENVDDRARHGTTARGAKLSKLSAEQVAEIRASDESNTVLAKRYGVNFTTITRIRKRERW